jgi:hypothetical protein
LRLTLRPVKASVRGAILAVQPRTTTAMGLRFTPYLAGSVLSFALSTSAADLKDCIKLEPKGADATLTNLCTNAIVIMYCVDNAASQRSCANNVDRVVTLAPTGVEVIPEFGGSAKGELYTALCPYQQAPVGWKPGPNNPYTCKKTCVMC